MRTTVFMIMLMVSVFFIAPVEVVHAATETYVHVAGIPGNAVDDRHMDWLRVFKYEWGVQRPDSDRVSSGGAKSSVRAAHAPLIITMQMDRSFPKLSRAAMNGKPIKGVTLEEILASGDKSKVLTIKLLDVVVQSVELGKRAGKKGGPWPLVTVGFDYGIMELIYHDKDRKTGKPAGDVPIRWDLHQNKGG